MLVIRGYELDNKPHKRCYHGNGKLFFVLIAIRYKSQQSPYDASNERKLFQSLHNHMPQ